MKSWLCLELEDPADSRRGIRMALRMAVRSDAMKLALSHKEGPDRITFRLFLIETLEACKTVGEWFWRDCVANARETMQRESKS